MCSKIRSDADAVTAKIVAKCASHLAEYSGRTSTTAIDWIRHQADVICVVQQRHEPFLPVPLRCFSHPLEAARHGLRTRRPGRGRLQQVPFRFGPSFGHLGGCLRRVNGTTSPFDCRMAGTTAVSVFRLHRPDGGHRHPHPHPALPVLVHEGLRARSGSKIPWDHRWTRRAPISMLP